jgi:hypothetical protein
MPAYSGTRLKVAIKEMEMDPEKLRDPALRRAVASAEGDSKDLLVLSGVLASSLGSASTQVHPDVSAVSAALRRRIHR